MKRTTLLVLIATLMTAVPACAQTTPAPVTPPTPPNPPVAPTPPTPPSAPTPSAGVVRGDPFAASQIVLREFSPAMEKGSYLGVTTSPVPAVLRDQLRLRPGLGLVIDFVRPESPAAAAGLRQNDILEKFDDQLLVSNQQLAILVRMHKAGDEVKLSVIREAKPQSIAVTLTEADVVPLEQLSRGGDMRTYDSALKLLHSAQSMTAKPFPGGAVGGGGWQGMPSKTWAPDQNATYGVVWSDKEHTFEISQDKEKGRHLVAKDKSGKVIFDGPIETDEQIDKLPAEIRDKVKKIKVIRLEPPQSTTGPAFRNTLKSSSSSKWGPTPTPTPAPMPGI